MRHRGQGVATGTPARLTRGWWAAAATGIAVIALYLGGLVREGAVDGLSLYLTATMAVGMSVGLWAWGWRPGAHMGPLMFWWPALWLAQYLPLAYPASSLASTIGVALFVFGPIVFAQMALSYPTGRLLPGRLAWVYVFVLGYAAQVVQNAYNLVFLDARDCPFCPPPTQPTYFHVDADPPVSLETWNDGWLVFVMVILPIGLYLLYRAYARASRAARRSIGPVVLTATFITCTSWVTSYAVFTDHYSALTPISWLQTTGALAAALTALVGLIVVRWARGPVGDLVVELERAGPGSVARALATTIGDPTLELALWLPERGIWVDAEGHEVDLPSGRDRAVTMVGDQLAAIVHDPVLLDQPGLLEAAGAAAVLALENERLQAELRLQLTELRESRARIARARDDERRRIERDLHDGAQQRLLGIGMTLRGLATRVADDDEGAALLRQATTELQDALTELRELASGIYPPILTDQGLEAAVRSLAERAAIPVEVVVDLDGARPTAEVELAGYFVVAEGLANVTKHASASHASVTVSGDRSGVCVEIVDDGIGGAGASAAGSGLGGLADRVGALDGTLEIDSPSGGGTRLRAEIPCESR